MTKKTCLLLILLGCSGGFTAAQTLPLRRNLLEGGGFERVDQGMPAGWRWEPGRAKAELATDEKLSHGGTRSIRLTNRTPQAPHVYGYLETAAELSPEGTYTLSCWYRSDDPGVTWIGGGRDWRLRKQFQPTGDQWRRAEITFRAEDSERSFRVMILSESPTAAVWIDDVQLEAGANATDFEHIPAVEPGKPVLLVQPIRPPPNLLPNSSFETVEGDRPKHWQWNRQNTDATLKVDDTVAHSGGRSLRITNGTPYCPHVFGILQLPGLVTVRPDTAYTFSCYVKGPRIGIAWFGGGRDWRIRARMPKTTAGGWFRVVMGFTTEEDETKIPVMLVTENPTEPFWVDDVQLLEGAQAMPVLDPRKADSPVLHVEFPDTPALSHHGHVIARDWNVTDFPRSRYLFTPRILRTHGWLHLPRDLADATLRGQLTAADGETLAGESRRGRLPAGTYLLSFGCWTADVPPRDVSLRVSLEEKPSAGADPVQLETSLKRRLITTAGVTAALDRVETLEDELRRHVRSLTDARRDPAYPRATLAVLENFVGYAREDVAHDELARAYDAAVQMEKMAKQALKREFLPPVPRYATVDKRPPFRIEGPAQLGTVDWVDGRTETGWPLQLVGVGAFSQVHRDIGKFNDYGCNLIQIEFGPQSVVTGDGQISTDTIEVYLKLFDRAAKADVAVNLLLSPHYFPAWAFKKWPHLKDGGGGFMKFDVYAPEAREVLEKSLRTVIPRIRHHPALHSICLSNEPVHTEGRKSRFVRRKWHRWLREKHGTIETLNRRWGSEHADFDSIPVPPAEFEPSPLVYDFVCFNQESFAEFHAWMASIIHELAPDLAVHAKIMVCANFERHPHGPWSVSPELFAALSDINGNDAWKYYRTEGPWACSWLEENMGYDFQRSMAEAPVFNSENHLIPDRTFDYVPPEHIANVFWQGAIHGQSATTTWVWQRTYAQDSDISGSIMHRPKCTEAMGHTALDLMRLSKEVTALQRLPIRVALVWSPASVVAGEEYLKLLKRTYEALNFCGLRLGFVTERQLAGCAATGELPATLSGVKLIVAPGAVRTPASTVTALEKFQQRGGKVLLLGKCFTHDEYGKQRDGGHDLPKAVEPPAGGEMAFDFFRRQIAAVPIPQPVQLRTADGKPAWGVEYLAVRHDGRLLVNLSNYLSRPQSLSVVADGKAVGGTDLRSSRAVGETFDLPPLEPVLLEIR